jgi:hypothetical protein
MTADDIKAARERLADDIKAARARLAELQEEQLLATLRRHIELLEHPAPAVRIPDTRWDWLKIVVAVSVPLGFWGAIIVVLLKH